MCKILKSFFLLYSKRIEITSYNKEKENILIENTSEGSL